MVAPLSPGDSKRVGAEDLTQVLSTVQCLPGVVGTAVFTSHGDCLAKLVEGSVTESLLSRLYVQLEAAVKQNAVQRSRLGAQCLTLPEGVVMRRAGPSRSILALCTAQASSSLVDAAMEVALVRLTEAVLGSSGRDFRASLPAATFSGASQLPAIPRAPGAMKLDSLPTNPRMNWHGSPQHPSAVSPRVLRHVLMTLTRYKGAQAQPILERELERLGATPLTLRVDQFNDLVTAASEHVTATQRRRFVEEALGDGH